MKAIVIGTSLAGKTTLVRYLRAGASLNILEIDELLTELNGGEYPSDVDLKNNVVAPKAIAHVLSQPDNTIFFSNTDYFSDNDLINARDKGFKIIQLSINREELLRRNTQRMRDEGYDDMTKWLDGMLEYQERIYEKGFVDKVIDCSQPVEKVAEEIVNYLAK